MLGKNWHSLSFLSSNSHFVETIKPQNSTAEPSYNTFDNTLHKLTQNSFVLCVLLQTMSVGNQLFCVPFHAYDFAFLLLQHFIIERLLVIDMQCSEVSVFFSVRISVWPCECWGNIPGCLKNILFAF